MSERGRVISSEYMPWAKTRSHAKFNLAVSGMPACSIKDLPVTMADLEINGPGGYGFGPLQQALADKSGVSPDCIVHAAGTSMANHLAIGALIEPGDEVLIEHPVYELILSTALYLGADVKRFRRNPENGFNIDLDNLERVVSPRTRLIVLTNLHNPSSCFDDEETLLRVGEIAARAGATVLVDEVYLDAAFDQRPRSAFHLGHNFVVTNSLTKVYGLSGLRCGWIVAQPELARKMWRLNDLFGVIAPHAAELLSVIALANLDPIRERSRALLEPNREVLRRFIDSCEGISVPAADYGTVVFPRLLRGSVDELCDLLRTKYETSVVPGRFFEIPDRFRLGIACAPEVLTEGLDRLANAVKSIAE